MAADLSQSQREAVLRPHRRAAVFDAQPGGSRA